VARDGDKEVAIAVPENQAPPLLVGEKVAARFWADRHHATGTVREIAAAPTRWRAHSRSGSAYERPRHRLGMTAAVTATSPRRRGDRGSRRGFVRAGRRAVVWVVDPVSPDRRPRSVALADFAAGGVPHRLRPFVR